MSEVMSEQQKTLIYRILFCLLVVLCMALSLNMVLAGPSLSNTDAQPNPGILQNQQLLDLDGNEDVSRVWP